MQLRTHLVLDLLCILLVAPLALADHQPTPRDKAMVKEPTSEELKRAIGECLRQRVSYRMEVDPFTKKPIHSFVVRDPVDEFPRIPFPYELAIWAPPEGPFPGLSAYDSTRLITGVRFRVNTKDLEIDWKKLRGVQSLTFEGTARWDNRELVQMDSLTTLVGPFDDADLKELKKLKGLKRLYTSGRAGDAALQEIGEFPALEHLMFSGTPSSSHKLTPEGIHHLQRAKNLKRLAIMNNSGIGENEIAELSKLKGITHLELRQVGASSKGLPLDQLESLESLVSLELADVRPRGPESIRFEKCPSLERIVLEGKWVSENWIKEMKELKRLQSLTLLETKLSDAQLAPLRNHRLDTLILSQTYTPRDRNLTGVGVASVIKGMKSLTTLSIETIPLFPLESSKPSDTPFGDPKKPDPAEAHKRKADIVAALQSLTNLRRLNVMRTGVTDEDIEWLKEMKSLHYLYLDQKVSSAAIAKLKKALPNCTIAQSLRYPAQFGNELAD